MIGRFRVKPDVDRHDIVLAGHETNLRLNLDVQKDCAKTSNESGIDL